MANLVLKIYSSKEIANDPGAASTLLIAVYRLPDNQAVTSSFILRRIVSARGFAFPESILCNRSTVS